MSKAIGFKQINRFQQLINGLLYIGMLWASYAFTRYLQAKDVGWGLSIVIGSVSLMYVILILERVFPYRKDWNQWGVDNYLYDMSHAFFGTALGKTMGKTLVSMLTLFAASSFFEKTDLHFTFFKNLDFNVQVAVAFLLADFSRYWQHRLMHEVPILWHFHELHHEPKFLITTKSGVSHFVERFTQPIAMFFLPLVLGLPKEALDLYVIVTSAQAVVTHSNLSLSCWPLEYVLMGTDTHRVHHSSVLEEEQKNYGIILTVWDYLFGSFQSAYSGKEVGEVGCKTDIPAHERWYRRFTWTTVMPFMNVAGFSNKTEKPRQRASG